MLTQHWFAKIMSLKQSTELNCVKGTGLFKGERKKFKKDLIFSLCNNIWLENFIFYQKTCFSRKARIYLFYYNAMFKDRVLFK